MKMHFDIFIFIESKTEVNEMDKKQKCLTRIGLMAGAEVGADFFKPWRAEKARKDFIEGKTDFIICPGGLLNMEGLNEKMAEKILKRKKGRKGYKFTHKDREKFCSEIIKQILEDVLPPIHGNDDVPIKYWVFPCPLFELKKDKYGIATYIYEGLERESAKKNKQEPYIRVGSDKELIEIEDDVAIRTLGIIMPTTTFFRAKILSTPIEREITYHQLASIARSVPDLYIAGSFGASISEVNPRTVPLPRPYISVPSLAIKLTETVLQNTMGLAILTLHPAEKNRPQFEVSFRPLNDAIDLECIHAKKEFRTLKDEAQKQVAAAIVDKIQIGTKVTVGKIETATGLSHEKVIGALQGLRRQRLKINLELGEIKNPYHIIPNTKKDLTEYREGELKERTFVGGACLHIPDTSVDYDFVERDLPRILAEEKADTLYLVGDITEGNKYDQDRKGEILDRIFVPRDQKEIAGFIIAYVAARAFKDRLKETGDYREALLRVVSIPGNHDEVKNEPPLEGYDGTLRLVLTKLIYRHLTEKNKEKTVSYEDVEQLVREKILFFDNPALDDDTGLLHEYSQSAEQSTGKVQKASKQFLVMSEAQRVLMANHHEENFLILRVGKRTIELGHIGTFKRFYGFESKRSKISEFGVAIMHDIWRNGQLVRADIKFIPSIIDFEMKDGKNHQERNKIRGVAYYERIKRYKETGELPPLE